MFMYKKEIPILSVTNRKLCREDFLSRIERIAAANPAGIILREKDLSEEEYRSLAEQVLNICRKQGTPCILHSFYETALELECDSVHLPLPAAILRPDMFLRLTVKKDCREEAWISWNRYAGAFRFRFMP